MPGSRSRHDTDLSTAEAIRRDFSAAWGELGAAWGVAPSTAAVQGYLLAHGGPLTEPEIRRALGLSHRAASLALLQCEEWGLIRRAAAPRRSGQRGPVATAYEMVGSNWEWFRRVAQARKERETDPVVPVLDRCVQAAAREARASHDPELAELAERLEGLGTFVRLFDRGVGVIVDGSPEATETLFALIGEVEPAALPRLLELVGTLPPRELARALTTLSRLSPRAARRLLSLAAQPALARLVRTSHVAAEARPPVAERDRR